MSSLDCTAPGCQHKAVYCLDGVLIRGKVEDPGINNGGFFYSVPVSSTGTETTDLSEYACEEHATRASVTARLRAAKAAADRQLRISGKEPEGLERFSWRIAEFRRRLLP